VGKFTSLCLSFLPCKTEIVIIKCWKWNLAQNKSFISICYYCYCWVVFFFKDFIYLRERAQAQARGGRGRGRIRLPTEQGAQCGTRSQDPEIMTWAEGRRLANWATQVPHYCWVLRKEGKVLFFMHLNLGTRDYYLESTDTKIWRKGRSHSEFKHSAEFQ